MTSECGELVYKIYRALTHGLTPLIHLHLRWRKLRGREHPLRWRERLGRPSLRRPPGPLIWFHAVSLGEGMAAIPVIKCCVERRSDVAVLMTTTTTSAFEVIKNQLPSDVIYQFAPLDIPTAMDAFLGYWKPNAVILLESELWPNLIMSAARNGIALTLLNGRMSNKSFQIWSHPAILPLIRFMLSKFSLILPLSTKQGIHFQLLQAPPFIINFSGDLKYAIDDFGILEVEKRIQEDLQMQLAHRKVWMASSIHKAEEDVILRAHNMLKQIHPDIVTIIVPRQPQHGREIAVKLQKEGVLVALRSRHDKLTPGTNIYVVDSLGELRDFYRLTPIAVVGGSFLPGSAGHNISEAAATGCAVLTGHHIGHFSQMALEMQRLNPLSVLQISGEKLVDAVTELLCNDEILEARRTAAKQAYHALSSGIVENVWRQLHFHIFHKSMPGIKVEVQRT
ncbi:putative 3-deoxy-D-manno-octulosonic acid transferase [Abeliophyllum distichum]|uniref:lipid IVA 3-deoxy-D-manno-octulosonic acid transferase n=1 Tax=Abeliophyllum distichum TaxID=126358 RepID=A0ABD1QYI6_9LAMI